MVHQQFTRTVRLDLKTCWEAWGYWMLERKAGETTDDESDSTDDESDAGNGYPPGWGCMYEPTRGVQACSIIFGEECRDTVS